MKTYGSGISIIAAIDKNRGIGKKGKLPWHIPGELKRFKYITMRHPIIMGRKTHQSIGKALPGRTNIIITRDPNFIAKGCLVTHSLDEALRLAKLAQGSEEIFIIGGGEMYRQAIDLADKLYLTLVEGEFEADTFFPDYSKFNKVIFSQVGESEGYQYQILELEKDK